MEKFIIMEEQYIAQNIDTQKILDELRFMREEAEITHMTNVRMEDKRYEQQIADLKSFEELFFCPDYEKTNI
jgi:hypothetical protein